MVKYNQLYSVYSYPNMIMPLVGGMLIDKIGIHLSMILFSLLVVFGQGVFTIAGYTADNSIDSNWPFIFSLVGRLRNGLGGESLFVCQSVIVSKWFLNNELSLALWIIQWWMMIGNTLWGFIIPPIAKESSLGFSISIAFYISIISFVFIIILIFTEEHLCRGTIIYTLNPETEKFKCKDIKEIEVTFWVIILAYFCSFSWTMFYGVLNDFFTTRYGVSQIISARVNGNIFLMWIAFAIFGSYLWDRYGHRVTLWILSTLMIMISNLLFAIIPSSTPENITFSLKNYKIN